LIAENPDNKYEARKERERARNAAVSHSGRDIGTPPKPLDPKRRKKAVAGLLFFLDTYFPELFTLDWSDDHLRVIAKMEQAIVHGGLFAVAMPRGSGKTTIAECSAIWAVITGRHPMAVLIGSDEGHAADMLASIKLEMEVNEALSDDFPEVCYPIGRLEGIANRASGQLSDGERTRIEWTQKVLVLPTIAGSQASGAIIKVRGITGGIRGMKHKRADGRVVRPTLVIPDDPQTDESARSPGQNNYRLGILAGAVLGLAGPGKKISGLMPCTVIHPGDMVDQILDRNRFPEWDSERTKMIYQFPTNEKLWAEYSEVRADGMRAGDRGKAGTAFYKKHRKKMDKGSVVGWPERYNPDELSAIQNAMNLRMYDEAAFFAEYQNDPIVENESDLDLITADDLAAKTNGIKRGVVPDASTKLTMFVDVSKKVLWWSVVAWDNAFTGHVVDYGIWPEQPTNYSTLASIKKTLMMKKRGAGFEAALIAGLGSLADHTLGREWKTESGDVARIDHCLIDEGYATDQVRDFCKRSKFSAILSTSKGVAWKASSRWYGPTLSKAKPGEGRGDHLTQYRSKTGRRVLVDVFHWKTFIFRRLAVPIGDAGALSLFEAKPSRHRMVAEQVTAEHPVKTEGQGQIVYEWKTLPGRPDNHFLDCFVGAAACASMLGLSLGGKRLAPKPVKKLKRKRVYAMG